MEGGNEKGDMKSKYYCKFLCACAWAILLRLWKNYLAFNLAMAGTSQWRAARNGGQLAMAGSSQWRAARNGGQLAMAGSSQWRAARNSG